MLRLREFDDATVHRGEVFLQRGILRAERFAAGLQLHGLPRLLGTLLVACETFLLKLALTGGEFVARLIAFRLRGSELLADPGQLLPQALDLLADLAFAPRQFFTFAGDARELAQQIFMGL